MTPMPASGFRSRWRCGYINDERAGTALARILRRDGKDPWMRVAALSSTAPHADIVLLAFLRESGALGGTASLTPDVLASLLRLTVGTRNEVPLRMLEQAIATPAGKDGRFAPWQFTALFGLLEARDLVHREPALDFVKPFVSVWPAARRALADEKTDEAERMAAATLVGYGARRDGKDRDLLVSLIRPQVSLLLQQEVVTALGKSTDPKLPDLLVHEWRRHSPQVRSVILDTLLSRTAWTSSLLSSLEDGCVPPGDIDPARRQQLLVRRSPSLRARAKPSSPTRLDPVRPWLTRSARPLPPGATAPQAPAFSKNCAPRAIALEMKASRSAPTSLP